jgi:hypothetical protein
MVVGLRRRHPYDVFWMHGDPATITRDAVFRGTAVPFDFGMVTSWR